ncbi:MAG: hypothetical protein JNN01_12290 [Opitutaceae bacterium]|nr:hypothetical protein [Opitutaceae bacterium]
MNIRTIASLTLPLCLCLQLQAQWQKFDDFQGGNLNKWTFTQSDVGTTADSSAEIVADPDPAAAAAGNKVMRMNPGSPYASDHRSRLIGRIPPINYGTTGTAFFRWYTATVTINGTKFAPEIDMVIGLSAVDIPTQYNEYGPLAGYDVGEAQFRSYNGDANPDNPAAVVGFQNILTNRPNDVWVSQWFYVRNLDVANQRQDYQIYYRVGNTGTPILAYPFVAGEFAGFRAKPDGDLDQAAAHLDVFAFTASAGTIAVPQALDNAFLADDVYVDQNGLNLTDPVAPGGTPVPSTAPKLVNLATRGEVLTGDKILIAGFTISGSTPQQVLIRAVGPTLGGFGVAGTLQAPVLNLYSSAGTLLNTNTRWGTATNAAAIPAAAASVGAFPLTAGSADSCLLVTLPPGGYSAQISGAGATTGVVLAEVYSISQ